jgi:hypothetical protein
LSLETLLAEASQSDQAKQETEADFMAAKSALEAPNKPSPMRMLLPNPR